MVSSGATMPHRAPHSMERLHRVMRPSIDSARTAAPAYSTACPAPPSAPNRAMTERAISLAPTPGAVRPSTSTRIRFGLRCHSVWVVRTCATSEAPMPKAMAPKAPWVEV